MNLAARIRASEPIAGEAADAAVYDMPFLSEEDAARFSSGRRLSRTIQERPLHGEAGGTLALERLALQEAREFLRGTASGLRCILVAVNEDDGMSWSATAVARELAGLAPDIPRVLLRPAGPDRLPAVHQALPAQTLSRLALRSGIVESGRPHNKLRLGIILVVLVVASVAVSYFSALLQASTKEPSLGLLLQPAFLIPAVLLPLLGLIVAATKPSLVQGEVKASELVKDIDAAARERSDAHEGLCAELARELGRPSLRARLGRRSARFVLVDAYERLDSTTRKTIVKFLTTASVGRRRLDLWIVFETKELDDLRKQLVVKSNRPGYRLASYRQLFLDDAQRRLLAESAGHPERAHMLSVKAICRREDLSEGDLGRLFRQHRSANPVRKGAYGSLEILYLVSLAFAVGGHPELRAGQIESRLTAGNHRREVLSAFLRGAPIKRNELLGRFNEARRTFGELLTEREHQLRMAPEAGLLLATRASDYSLPDGRLGHLFWSLYWLDYEKEFADYAWWRRKLAAHVVEAAPPSVLGLELGPEVDERLFVASVNGAQRCIEACLLDDVSAMLTRGLELVDPEDQSIWRSRGARLRRAAWNAYGVLGDDEVLQVIMRLESWRTLDDAGGTRPRSTGQVERLFVEAAEVADGESREALDLLISRDEGRDSLRAYAGVRGAWLALTLAPFTKALSVPVASAAVESLLVLPRFTEEALHRLQHPERQAVDFQAASLGLWCLTIAVTSRFPPRLHTSRLAASKLLDLLETASVQALELTPVEGLREDSRGYDLLREGLARELAVIVGACAVLLDRQRAETGAHSPAGERIDRLLGDAHELLSISDEAEQGAATLERVVAAEMNLLALMWNALGLRQLGCFVSLRRAHFRVLIRPEQDDSLYTETVRSLANESSTVGTVGLLANVIAAESSRSKQISAKLLVRGIDLAREGRLGKELAGDLSLVAIMSSHSYAINLDSFVQQLVGTDGEPNLLPERLAALSDPEIAHLVLPLTNAMRSVERPGLARRVVEALSSRQKVMENDDAAESVAEQLDLYEVEAAVAAGDPIDVDSMLAAWEPRRGKGSFAGMLLTLLRRQVDARLVSRAIEVLDAARENGDFSSTAFVHLAREITDEAADDATARRAAAEYLRPAIDTWETELQIKATIDVLRILRRHFEDQSADVRLVFWEVQMHEDDRLEKLPSLVARGRYFMLFQHYYYELEHWGLPARFEEGGVFSRAVDQSPRGLIDQWTAESERVPPPLVTENGRSALSLDFIALGGMLFGELEQDDSLQAARDEFDRAAEDALKPLYELVVAAGSIPAPIRSVLRRHQELVASRSTPAAAP